MPMKKIIKKIKEDTKNKVDDILWRGEKKAEEIKNQIDKEKEHKLDQIKKEKGREIKTMKNMILSQAKLEAKKKKLEIREEMITEVLDRAREEIEQMDPEEYKIYLQESIERADEIFHGKITLRCNKEAERLVDELAFDTDPDIEVKADLDTIGGIKAESETGSIDFTFEANLERLKKELRKEISQILFKEED